jgi:hypothetical protein
MICVLDKALQQDQHTNIELSKLKANINNYLASQEDSFFCQEDQTSIDNNNALF